MTDNHNYGTQAPWQSAPEATNGEAQSRPVDAPNQAARNHDGRSRGLGTAMTTHEQRTTYSYRPTAAQKQPPAIAARNTSDTNDDLRSAPPWPGTSSALTAATKRRSHSNGYKHTTSLTAPLSGGYPKAINCAASAQAAAADSLEVAGHAHRTSTTTTDAVKAMLHAANASEPSYASHATSRLVNSNTCSGARQPLNSRSSSTTAADRGRFSEPELGMTPVPRLLFCVESDKSRA